MNICTLQKNIRPHICVLCCSSTHWLCVLCMCGLIEPSCWGQGSSVSTPSLSRAHGTPLFPSALGTNKPGSAVLLSTAGCHSTLRLINQSQGRLDFKQKQTPAGHFYFDGILQLKCCKYLWETIRMKAFE